MYTKRFIPRAWFATALATVLGAFASSAMADPPERVARVGFLRGDVSFQVAGDDRWVEASLNRPLGTGDKIYTDRDSRAELEIGAAAVRLDEKSTFNLINLDDNIAQMELTEGVLNLRVRRLADGQSYEVDTPTLAFVVSQPGEYRIDIAPQGDSTMVTVVDGGGDVYGENNASYSVRAGNSYRFNDTALRDYEVLDLPRKDDFDNWVASRDTRFERSVSSRYVADDMIGYADLDDNGSWNDDREYGNVWYPTSVAADWAPYRSGHWSWIDPWGWTWVDNASWGFAPFHYGRWVQVRNRWGWCPGPRHVRAVYAPALVAFYGGGGWGGAHVSIGGGGPVGWFPLGPRDVYVPWYRASRGYFTNINVRNTTVINNTYITNVYNNYSSGRPMANVQYAYRNNVNAMTAMSHDAFVGSRSVGDARVRVDEAQLRNAQVQSRLAIAPTQASFVAANAQRARAVPQAAAIDRRVIARTAPPPQPVATAARLQAIERNNGQPLARSEQRQIAAPRTGADAAARSRVQVVGQGQGAVRPQPLPTRGASMSQRQPGEMRTTPAQERSAVPANNRGQVNTPNVAPRTQPNANVNDRGTLPSSRFAPHGDRGNATPESRAVPNNRIDTPQTRQANPQREAREAPQMRQGPQQQQQQQNAPQVRQSTPQREVRDAPQMRQVQPQREAREAPQMRQAQPQPQREAREAPQMRQAQPQREAREAPQMRQAPQPQVQQREAPQMRQAPQPQQQQVQQRAQPQERKAVERKSDDKDDKEENRRR